VSQVLSDYSRPISVCRRPFVVRVRSRDRQHVRLDLFGELDVASAESFKRLLDRHIDAGRRRIELDLSGLNFVDCAGLRPIVATNAALARVHGQLTLTGVGGRTARLLRLTGLDTALDIAVEGR
jgi:anti-sigma B factor antagonist